MEKFTNEDLVAPPQAMDTVVMIHVASHNEPIYRDRIGAGSTIIIYCNLVCKQKRGFNECAVCDEFDLLIIRWISSVEFMCRSQCRLTVW